MPICPSILLVGRWRALWLRAGRWGSQQVSVFQGCLATWRPCRWEEGLGVAWTRFCGGELARGVAGCSQLLAADLCKYGLRSLAPVLPSPFPSPAPEHSGH